MNGFGGKVKNNETIEEAALRELYEEAGVEAELNDIRKVAELTFVFPSVPKEKEWDQTVHVFLVERWNGSVRETEEMKPMWVEVDNIPFEKMWEDDRHWLPLVLQNKLIRAKFIFKDDNESIQDMILEEVSEF